MRRIHHHEAPEEKLLPAIGTKEQAVRKHIFAVLNGTAAIGQTGLEIGTYSTGRAIHALGQGIKAGLRGLMGKDHQ